MSAPTATVARPSRLPFSATLYRIEAIRQLRNPYALIFTLILPAAMYLLFGVSMSYGDMSAGHGNIKWYVMVSMAAFGTATAMSSLCSLAASEVRQGWGRQIAMSPLPIVGYAVTKVLSAVSFGAVSVLLLFIVGMATGATADDLWRWFAAAALILGIGLIFGFWGMGIGLLFNSDSAAALASIAITFFGFLGNVFMPLSGVMLAIAKFTPMYGYVALVRWPVSEGVLQTQDAESDPMWMLIVNVAAWAVVFFALALLGVRRSRRRA